MNQVEVKPSTYQVEVKALIMYQTTDTEREIGWHAVWYNTNSVSLFSPKNYEAEATKASVIQHLFSRMRQIQCLGYGWSVILGSVSLLLYLNLPSWFSLYFKSLSELLCRRAAKKEIWFLRWIASGIVKETLERNWEGGVAERCKV